MNEHFDVLIIGAGLSGIGTACQISREFPGKRLAVLERRETLGGTWDLFRYPGIRSDSDMFSLGYKFRPWNELKVLADGPAIRQYIADTAAEFGIDKKIQYGVKILSANWSSEQRRWTLSAVHETSGEMREYSCGYLICCTGYYNQDAGFRPRFPGEEQFKGQCIHPQHWPENLDYAGKKVVVIGSGATAISVVPAMAGTAAHVTMLQRSPSYVFSVPALDSLSKALASFLPKSWVYRFARKRNITLQRWLYLACKRWPKLMRRWLLANVRKHVGENFDMRHFTPSYMPWDERLCAVPNADLFHTLRDGKASVETDQIDTLTENGIRLKSGKLLEADIIVTATGLSLQMLGGMDLQVDGVARPFNAQMIYKGILVEDLPNIAWMFGYTNSSWTLKSDIAGQYLCRLFGHMDAGGLDVAVPRDFEGCSLPSGVLDSLKSGYVQRAMDTLPRQGDRLPWKMTMNYETDSRMLLEEPIDDGVLQFDATPGAGRSSSNAPMSSFESTVLAAA